MPPFVNWVTFSPFLAMQMLSLKQPAELAAARRGSHWIKASTYGALLSATHSFLHFLWTCFQIRVQGNSCLFLLANGTRATVDIFCRGTLRNSWKKNLLKQSVELCLVTKESPYFPCPYSPFHEEKVLNTGRPQFQFPWEKVAFIFLFCLNV